MNVQEAVRLTQALSPPRWGFPPTMTCLRTMGRILKSIWTA